MTRRLEVTLPEYHKNPVKPQNFMDFCDMYEATDGPLGLWCLKLSDRRTNEIKKEIWTKNVVTDNGATAMLKNVWNNAGSAVTIMNQIAIAAQQGSTTLTTAIAISTSGITSLAVAALPAAIPSGTTLTLGYGTGTNQNVVTSALAALNATTISVTSFNTDASHSYAIGSSVVPVPTTSDNPSSVTGAQYSGALSAGAFTFSGTGAGNRQVVISFTFNGGSFTAGNYTEAYTCTIATIGTGTTASHLITTPMSLNSSTNLTVTITEKV